MLNVKETSSTDALMNFSWEKEVTEMRERAPDVLDVITTSANPQKSTFLQFVWAIPFLDVSEEFEVRNVSKAVGSYVVVRWMQS